MLKSTVERRRGPLPTGEFSGPGRPGRRAKNRGEPEVWSVDAGTVEEVLGGASADATGSVCAHVFFSGAG